MSNLPPLRTPVDPPLAESRPSAPANVAPAKQAPPVQANARPQTVQVAPSPEDLKKLVSEMQRKVATISSDLQFSVDKETGKSTVKVTDRSTKQVVWQFPSEEALNITKALDRYQKGLLLNRQA